jgi:hypothetical protein
MPPGQDGEVSFFMSFKEKLDQKSATWTSYMSWNNWNC